MTDRSPSEQSTYPPLDVLKHVAEGVLIVDSGPLRVLGMPLPVRMTVIQLPGGDLWLHSPTRFSEGLRRELDELGRIRHLVAPDIAHWTFLLEWQRNCRDVITWAAPGLRERAQVQEAAVRIDRELTVVPPLEWAAEIDQVVVRGLNFSEVDFFHKPTRTLVLTDLVQKSRSREAAAVDAVGGPSGRGRGAGREGTDLSSHAHSSEAPRGQVSCNKVAGMEAGACDLQPRALVRTRRD